MLTENHYLGDCKRAIHVYEDEFGVIFFARPSSRNLPTHWLELSRWCITSEEPNAGSQQWAQARRWISEQSPATTVVSYSDPSVGHDGALYRACNWLWAPTWHRLRPPPTGGGDWGTGQQSVKDRWIFPLGRDEGREEALRVNDESLRRRFPWAEYAEPKWRRSHFSNGGGNYKRWINEETTTHTG